MRMLLSISINFNLYFIFFFTNAEQAQNNFMLMLENTPINIMLSEFSTKSKMISTLSG
jgi:hypothetical protein